jgi:hypothetical protein
VLPELAENSVSTNIDVSSNQITDLLTTYIEPSVNNRYLGMYYPIDRQSNTDLVNIGTESCEEIDQRGIERLTKATLLFNPDAKNSCEIGSVEIRNLTAADISGLKNSSLTELLDYYQENIDDINSILADKNTKPEEIQGLKEELKEYEDLLKYTKQYQKYRAIYVNPFSLVMPQETLNNTQVQAKALNSQNYEITVQSLGVGSLSGSGSSLIVQGAPNDPNLKCEWKPDLNRIMMYRTDGKVTSLSDTEYCRYTIKDKQTGASSTGILQGAFVNIKPIVKNDEYRISAENNLTVTVNPLENDSDDGDGPRMNGKAAFYRDKDGREIPIRIVKLPAGVNLSAEREGPCPGILPVKPVWWKIDL